MTRTGRNEPSMEPIVDRAYMRPATDPASEALFVSSLIAKGDVQPNNVIGTANISIVPANAPATMGAFNDVKALDAYNNTGLELPEEDNETYQEIGEEATLYNDYFLGTGYETVGYGVNGDSDDWMYGAEGIIAYTPEVGNQSDGFWPSSNRIVPLAEENLHPNIIVAMYAGALISADFNIEEGPYLGENWYSIDVMLNNIGLSGSVGITTLEFVSEAGLEFSDNFIDFSYHHQTDITPFAVLKYINN